MKPIKVPDALLAFPAGSRIRKMLPDTTAEQRAELRKSPWHRLFSDLFFRSKQMCNLQIQCKPNIDPGTAWRHVLCLLGTYACKHEHKEGGVVFLFQEWFSTASYECPKGQPVTIETPIQRQALDRITEISEELNLPD